MDKYSKYKDSGLEWIGEIPNHWSIGKIYQYGSLINGSTPSRKEPSYWENGTIPWMNSGEINKRIIESIDGRITEKGQKSSSTPFLDIGTVMVALNGQGKTKGTVGILETKTTCNQSLCGISFKKSIEPKYQFYYLESQYKPLRGLVGDSKREGISVSFLSQYPVLVPPLQEQTTISKYLDKKTSQINSLIEKIGQKVELLKEQRTSLINQCVTKGLNPDVEMKDSGIEWIGEIPIHWQQNRLGVLGVFSSSGIDKKSLEEEERVKMINYTTLVKNRTHTFSLFDTSDYMITTASEKNISEHSVKIGDLIFLPSSETFEDLGLSSVVIFDEPRVVYSYHVVRFRFKEEFYLEFKKYLCNHHGVLNQFSSNGKGTTRKILSRDSFRNIQVVFPPFKEQTLISKYLDKKTSQIDSLIEKETERIELLKEYRQSLISNIVTGKVKITQEMI